MGLDPTRKHRTGRADVVFVVAALLAAAAVLVWAVFG
jgi:hypothetical protein